MSDKHIKGREVTKAKDGQKIITDNASSANPDIKGLPGDRGFGGGPTDLSHSIKGVKANQTGR